MAKTYICEHCGEVIVVEEDDDNIILDPWPHIACYNCGNPIPLF